VKITINYILSEWLAHGSVMYSEEEAVSAFNRIKEILGEEYLQNIKFQGGGEQKGPHITIQAIELGLKLTSLTKVQNTDRLIEKLKEPHNLKTLSELSAIHHLSHGLDVIIEIEPITKRLSKSDSKPDFRVKHKEEGNWTYVEVKQPDDSEEKNAISDVFKSISPLIKNFTFDLSVELILWRRPSSSELSWLITEIEKSITHYEDQIKTLEDLGVLHLSKTRNFIEKPTEITKSEEYSAYLSQNQIILEANPQTGGIGKSLVCKVGFNDARAIRYLINASQQLPDDCPTIVWIDLSNIRSKRWPQLITNQLFEKPLLNKNISGCVLYRPNIRFEDTMLKVSNEYYFIKNLSAKQNLPNWFISKINALTSNH
jgi:hypothetical protein